MIEKTAIIGMGALGLMYGDVITKALGRDGAEFILDEGRAEAYKSKSFTVGGEKRDFKMVSEDLAAPADLVIVAVKWNGLLPALDTMKNCVGENTIILSVMNGISSEKIIAERYGAQRVLYTVAQGMDAMRFGNDLTYSRMGNLHIGTVSEKQRPMLEEVEAFFERVSMPHIVEDDILHRMWGKFMLNVGVNLACAAYETNYAGVLAPGQPHDVMSGAMRETMALARAEGVVITEADYDFYIKLIGTLHPEAIPSTAQDIVSKRQTEVDMFAGTVIEMSKKHGLKTPANELLYRKIKELEQSF